jgi:hypothetical protein
MAVRRPCAAVLSCSMQKFSLNNAMAHFSSVPDAALGYDKVPSLFRQNQESLPLQIHHLHYERLLGDLEGKARRLRSFGGLDWGPGMLDYRRTALDKGLTNTPSYAAVSEKIYRHAAGR